MFQVINEEPYIISNQDILGLMISDVKEIKQLLKLGVKKHDIAKRYKIDVYTVALIDKGILFLHIRI